METIPNNIPILKTKLYRPPLQADFVPRPRLMQHFEGWQQRPLTLISAPAGYGKTTLASSWLETLVAPTVWISLDEHDNDINLFLTYLLTAIRSMFPDTMADTFALLQAQGQPSNRVLTNSLINELDQIKEPYVLVLDDYQMITQMEIHDLLTILLQYPPHSLHLILTTRMDPPLDLMRLRARNQISELRAIHLRFSLSESSDYLRKLAKKPVDSQTAVYLSEKTEGWVTGIRLLALSIESIDEGDWARIDRVENNRMVEDYLMSIILSLQEPHFEECLLQTAVLDRFCAPLCDSFYQVANLPDDGFKGTSFINKLTQSNLFVIPMDTQGEWFRYHHLFRDLLLRQLENKRGKSFVDNLHKVASEWFAANGFLDEALQHALASDDEDAAITLIAQHRHKLMDNEEWRRLDRWIKQFTPEAVSQTIELLIAKTWVDYYFWYDLTQVMESLDLLETLIASAIEKPDKLTQLKAEIAALRSHFQYWFTEGEAALAGAQKALEIVPQHNECVYTAALEGRGGAYQILGQGDKAVASLDHALQFGIVQGSSSNARLLFTLCLVYWSEGDLINLLKVAKQLLNLSVKSEMIWSSAYAHYYLGIAYYERNDLVKAEEHFSVLFRQPDKYGMVNVCQAALPLGMLYMAQGHSKKARETQNCVEGISQERQNAIFITLSDLLKAELDIREGSVQAALNWTRNYKLGQLMAIPRFYFPELGYAIILLAADDQKEAKALLNRLEIHTESIHHTSARIKVLTLQALLAIRQADTALALAKLEQAVRLGQTGGFIRFFVDQGAEIAGLLHQLRGQGVAPRYISQILAAFPTNGVELETAVSLHNPSSNPSPTANKKFLNCLQTG